ncbi:MAG: SEFIR domain-containing protein [Nannocystaceae bacterium]
MPTRVFISYSHDSDAHRDRVLALADRLRADGLESVLDQYVAHPPQGWPSWAQQQIVEADFTILVCTPTYNRRFEGKEAAGVGNGATWEAWIIKQNLYEAGSRNYKMIPVVFEEGTAQDVPLVLRPFTSYQLPAGYDELYRHITDQPSSPAPPVGPPRTMQAKPRAGLFTGTSAQERGEPPPRHPPQRWSRVAIAAVGLVMMGTAAWQWWPRGTTAKLDTSDPESSPGPIPGPILKPPSQQEAPSTTDPVSTSADAVPATVTPDTPPAKVTKRTAPNRGKSKSPPPEPAPALAADPRRWKVLDVLTNSDRFVGKRVEFDGPAPLGTILTLDTRCEPPTTSTAGPRCLVRDDPDDPDGHYCFTRDAISIGRSLCIHPQGTKAESK